MSRLITDLEADAKELIERLMDEVYQKLRVRLILIHTLRTWEEQALLYSRGRTTPGPVVTNARPGYSYHNFGLAGDFAILTGKGKIVWGGPWDKIGAIGKELGLTWGGDFDIDKNKAGQQPDLGHFELRRKGETLATLRSAHEVRLVRIGGHAEIKWS